MDHGPSKSAHYLLNAKAVLISHFLNGNSKNGMRIHADATAYSQRAETQGTGFKTDFPLKNQVL